MTFDAKETSQHEGSPVELYQFAYGETYFRYTSAAEAQEHGSEVFEPEAISRNENQQSQEDHSGNIEVRVPRDNEVAALHIAYIPSEPVALTIFRRHLLDGDLETVVVFVGSILSVRFESEVSEAVLTCGPVTEALRLTVPAVLYQPQCNKALYSAECGVDKEAFKVTATVTAIDGFTISADEFASSGTPDGWFNGGWVQRQADPADKRWVNNHVGDTITLMNPFQDLDVSDVVEAFPGCNRDENHCHNKFNNLPEHFGFSRIPTRNPFDTSVEY